MAAVSVLFGLLMVGLGLLGFYSPETLGEGEAGAKTALIPSYFGAGLAVCGLIGLLAPKANKHVMHLAAMLGLFGLIGGFVPAIRSSFNFEKAATLIGIGLSVLSGIFIVLCVRSFIAARRARQLGQTTPTA